jgi:hypothetical protein
VFGERCDLQLFVEDEIHISTVGENLSHVPSMVCVQ